MTKIKLGQLADWVTVVRNANAQGYRLSPVGQRDPAIIRYSVERDDDTGALEVYGWDDAGQYGTLVAHLHDGRFTRTSGPWAQEECCG